MEKDFKKFRVINGAHSAHSDHPDSHQDSHQVHDDQPPKRRQFRRLSPRRMAPALLTLLAMSLGFTSLVWAKGGYYESALILIVVAAVLDAVDGRIARLLKVDSRFGAELDSLADFLNFGVAPAFLMWLWTGQALGNLGVVLAFFFAMCCAVRLARFNANLVDHGDEAINQAHYFSGVPAPAGGLLVMMPMMLDFVGFGTKDFVGLSVFFMLAFALLMISQVPTFSLKAIKFRIPRRNFVPLLLILVVTGVMIFNFPREALLLVGVLYIGLLPVSAIKYYRETYKKS